jgi:hypothetical protein
MDVSREISKKFLPGRLFYRRIRRSTPPTTQAMRNNPHTSASPKATCECVLGSYRLAGGE